jgi:hypothetical protein
MNIRMISETIGFSAKIRTILKKNAQLYGLSKISHSSYKAALLQAIMALCRKLYLLWSFFLNMLSS